MRWERGQVGIWELVRRRRRLEIWKFDPGYLEIWKYGTWKSGKLESKKSQKWKKSKSKSVSPKMSARSGLVILGTKLILIPIWGHFNHFFHGPEKCKNKFYFCYFPWWANGPYSPGLGSCAGVILESSGSFPTRTLWRITIANKNLGSACTSYYQFRESSRGRDRERAGDGLDTSALDRFWIEELQEDVFTPEFNEGRTGMYVAQYSSLFFQLASVIS